MEDEIDKRMHTMVNSHRVFLLMKGSPNFPKCGFSAQAIDLLQKLNIDFGHFDVLSDETIRQGAKEYANWPMFPQFYVDGKFIGGNDIVNDMAEKGDLQKMVG